MAVLERERFKRRGLHVLTLLECEQMIAHPLSSKPLLLSKARLATDDNKVIRGLLLRLFVCLFVLKGAETQNHESVQRAAMFVPAIGK